MSLLASLTAVDVGQLAQLGQRFRLDVHAGAGRHVVDDAGQADRVGNGGVVGDQPGLGGFVVVGGHQQQGVGAVGLRLLRQLDGIGGVVGAGAGHNRHAAGHAAHGVADALGVLVVRQGRGLAGGAADDDGVGMVGDLVVQDAAQLVIVDRAVGQHGG